MTREAQGTVSFDSLKQHGQRENGNGEGGVLESLSGINVRYDFGNLCPESVSYNPDM